MRSYCSIYVDAGYLTAAASVRLTGTSYRAATAMDVAGLLEGVVGQARQHSGLPLLRVHWYDAARSGVADGEQRRIATLPRVKLRLGRTSVHGEQKGVDLKLALDLITQAQNRVNDVVYLVSGDDDLTEAVEEAQHLGVQIVLLAVPDQDGRPVNVSRNLQMACDELLLVEPGMLDAHVTRATAPAAATPPLEPVAPARVTPAVLAAMTEQRAPAAVPPKRLVTAVPVYSSVTGQSTRPSTAAVSAGDDGAILTVVQRLLASWWPTAPTEARRDLLAGRPHIPQELDRTLLQDLSAGLGMDDLEVATRFRLREVFWEEAERM